MEVLSKHSTPQEPIFHNEGMQIMTSNKFVFNFLCVNRLKNLARMKEGRNGVESENYSALPYKPIV